MLGSGGSDFILCLSFPQIAYWRRLREEMKSRLFVIALQAKIQLGT
jgi:hypothetical protein